jgi:WD40 repeat protein
MKNLCSKVKIRGVRMFKFTKTKKVFVCSIAGLFFCVTKTMDKPVGIFISDNVKKEIIEVPRDIVQLSGTIAGMMADLGNIDPSTVIPVGNYSLDTIKIVFNTVLPLYKSKSPQGFSGDIQKIFTNLSLEALIDVINLFEYLEVPRDLLVMGRKYLLSVVQSMPIMDIARKECLNTINYDLLTDCIDETINCLAVKILQKKMSKEKMMVLYEQSAGEIRRLQFSPDGSKIACISETGSVERKTSKLVIWQVNMIHKPIEVDLTFQEGVAIMAFSPDGTKIGIGSLGFNNNLILCDANTGVIKDLHNDNQGYIASMAFSFDSKIMVTASSEFGDNGKLIFWDVKTGKQNILCDYPHKDLHSVVFRPKSAQVFTVDKNNILMWDANTGKTIKSFNGYATSKNCVRCSSDGSKFISMGGYITGEKRDFFLCDLGTYAIKKLDGIQQGVMSVAFSPDNIKFVSGSEDIRDQSNLILWDAKSGLVIKNFHQLGGTVDLISFSSKGTQFVAGSNNRGNNLVLCDAGTGERIIKLEGHREGVSFLIFSSDNITIVSGSDKNMIIWNANTGKPILNLNVNNKKIICSADGTTIVLMNKDLKGVYRLSLLSLISHEELQKFKEIETYKTQDILLLNALSCVGQYGQQELEIVRQFPEFIQDALRQ